MTDVLHAAMQQYGDAFLGVVVFVVIVSVLTGAALLFWSKIGRPMVETSRDNQVATAQTAIALKDAARANQAAAEASERAMTNATVVVESARQMMAEQKELAADGRVMLAELKSLHEDLAEHRQGDSQ